MPRSYVYLLPLSLVIAVYLTFVIYLIMGPSRCVAINAPPFNFNAVSWKALCEPACIQGHTRCCRSASLWNRFTYGQPGGELPGERGESDTPLLNGTPTRTGL